MSATIRKAHLSAAGDPSNLAVIEGQIEAPGKNEVQVDVIYAGFGGTDITMRLGRYPSQKPIPQTLGYCFVGRVRQNGPNSTQYTPGDYVTAVSMYDAQADRLNILEKYLVPVPPALTASSVTLQQVCGITVDWNTAYGLVYHAAKVKSGQSVFIHGLSGSVGYATTILCLRLGAKVYGTASPRNHAELHALGVTPFAYTDKNWIQTMREAGGVNAVFDPLGFESWDESYEILVSQCPTDGKGGILVGYGSNMATFAGKQTGSQYPQIAKLLAQNLKVWTSRRTTFYYIDRDSSDCRPDIETVFGMLERGEIQVPIKKVLPFDTASLREAHGNWGSIPGIGTMVVDVGGMYLKSTA